MIIGRQDIGFMHELMTSVTGGSYGVRDEGMLNSALVGIYEGFSGQEFYPSIEEKAARLCYNIVKCHPFVDGNKRAGVFAMLVMCEVCGIHLDCNDDDVAFLGVGVADGSVQYRDIVGWINSHKKNW